MNSNIATISTTHAQPPQIYIPPDRCHTREREYARRASLFPGNGATATTDPLTRKSSATNENGQNQGIFPSARLNQHYKFIPSYGNADDDFWEDLTVNQSNVLRRMSAVGGGQGPTAPVGNGPVVGKEQQRMLRDVVMKLRQNVEMGARNMGGVLPQNGQKKMPMMGAKMSRGASAASSRVGPIKNEREWSDERGNAGEKLAPYGLGAKLAAEFSGDLFLVLISSLSALGSDPVNGRLHAGLATGLVIFVLIASVGQISGGHFNPAVSFAITLAGKMPLHHMILYWMAQLGGGFVGAFLIWSILQPNDFEAIAGGATIFAKTQPWYQGVAAEAILTALLVQTILNAAVETPNNPLAPLAIGCTILVDIIGAGPLSGASMNPARSFGPCLVASIFSVRLTDSQIWSRHFIYWAGPFLGATISAFAFRSIFTRKSKSIKE